MRKQTEADVSYFKSDLAKIRAKPALYIGPTDSDGVFSILRELMDNGVDEARSGRNKLVHVWFDNTAIWVADGGEGIPVKKHEKAKISTLTHVLTNLQSSGKMQKGAYDDAIGTHGVGAKATNATSKEFQVWTFRDGSWWTTQFARGVETKSVQKGKPPKFANKSLNKGTIIRFVPDGKIFGTFDLEWVHSNVGGHKKCLDKVRAWAQMAAYMNPGLTIKLTDTKGKTQEWMSKEGIKEYIDKRLVTLGATALNKKLVMHTSKTMELALSFADVEGCEVEFFTNTVRNVEMGVHADALFKALSDALKPYKGKLEYTPTDLREGLVGVLNYKINAPQFDSQTKEKLVDVRVAKPAYQELLELLTEVFSANKNLANQLVKRASELRAMTLVFKADKAMIKNVKNAKSKVSAKLAGCVGKSTRPKELYLVEGDSASGCFRGDTEIQLINGETKTLKQLVNDRKNGIINYGYAHCNETGINIVPITSPRLVKYTKKVSLVTLDNGNTIECTRNHEWKLRDGTYCRADSLKAGSSLMPHYERIIDERIAGERRQVWHPNPVDRNGKVIGTGNYRGRWEYVYKIAVRAIPKLLKKKIKYDRKGIKCNTHHCDHNTLNDHPSNLRVMSEKKHRAYHARLTSTFASLKKGKENLHAILMATDKNYRKKVIKNSKKHFKEYWSKKENRKAQSERTTKHMALQANRKQISESVKAWWTPKRRKAQAARALEQSQDVKFQARRRLALQETRRLKFVEIALECNPLNFQQFDKQMKLWMKQTETVRVPFKQGFLAWRDFYNSFKELEKALQQKQKIVVNHKVVSVVNFVYDEPVAMYDASIDVYENYALGAGVYVHNTAKLIRDKSFQAVYPMRGKPLNVMEAPQDKINKNNEVSEIFAALGIDLASIKPGEKMPYDRIIVMADPDVDGKHINCLGLTLFYKFAPYLFKQGKVFLVNSPLFMSRFKNKLYFGMTREEIYKQTGSSKAEITYIKGWGEINAKDLSIAFDPKLRKLIRVLLPKDKDGEYKFQALMGKTSEYRQKLLLNMKSAEEEV